MRKLLKYFTPQAVEELRNAIYEAHGNEVYFIGKTNSEKIVEEIIVAARGNEFAVPAVKNSAKFGDVVIHNGNRLCEGILCSKKVTW